MGLSERLQDQTNSDSVFGRALSMRKSLSGSTDIAPEMVPQPPVDDDIEVDPGAAIRSLLKELQTQRYFGVTTPSHLFSLIHRHLLVRRGAILVPHRDGGMVPLATAGLDRTSAFRIRLLEEETEWLGTGKSAVILDDKRRSIFTGRLSRADARNTPRVVFVPFTHLKDVNAVLVILDSPLLQFDPKVLDVIVGALSESAGRLLFDGRQRPMDRRKTTSVFSSEYMPEIVERLKERATAANTSVVALEINLGPLIARIIDNHPHLDRARLLEDLLETTAFLTEKTHTVIHPGQQAAVLVGFDEPSAPPELIVHLLTVTLSSLFGTPYAELLAYTLRDTEDSSREE